METSKRKSGKANLAIPRESRASLSVYIDPSGEKLPADRKSVAISLTFRAQERTLSNEEVNAACDRLKQQLKAKLAVDFRE